MKNLVIVFVLLVFVLLMSAFVPSKVQLFQQIHKNVPEAILMSVPTKWHATQQNVFPNKLVSDFNGEEVEMNITAVPFNIHDDSIELVIKEDIEEFRAFASDLFSVENKGIITVDEGKNVAIVKHVRGVTDAMYVAVAYIPERSYMLCVAFTANNYQTFQELLPDFKTFVRSYKLVKEPTLAMKTNNGKEIYAN